MENLIAVGKIRKSHGLKGHIKIHSYSGEFDHFLKLKTLTLVRDNFRKEFVVEEIIPFSGDLLAKLKGIDSPEAVETVRDCEILVDRKFASKLNKGEFYINDLVGCKIMLKGECKGTVVSVYANAPSDLFEVIKEDGTTCFIPFLHQFIGDVDTSAKTIVLLESWFLE